MAAYLVRIYELTHEVSPGREGTVLMPERVRERPAVVVLHGVTPMDAERIVRESLANDAGALELLASPIAVVGSADSVRLYGHAA